MRTNMRSTVFLLVLGTCYLRCNARQPFKPRDGSLPFLVYFASRHRGLCMGSLVSRTAVITAAVCVTNPTSPVRDTRPINVIVGASYRHPRRGIRVQVVNVIIPDLKNVSTPNRGYLMQKSPAILLLKQKVPDMLAEIPLRPLAIDYKGEEELSLQEECMMPGWHFFNKGDKIYPERKFLLQRNVRVQFLNIAKKKVWCEALTMKFQKALTNLGFRGYIDSTACMCVRDPDRTAQPCHGMYGAPLICRGRAVAMLMAPDAQWTNCTGYSNIVHLFSSDYLKNFMTCVSRLFAEETRLDWSAMKKSVYEDLNDEEFDYVPEMYDRLDSASTSSDEL